MLRSLKTFILIGLTTILFNAAFAQIKIPAASSTQTIMQDFGLGKITLTYSRPNLKGRMMFGEMEPYGKVWRAGANAATTIEFTKDVTIEGKPVPAGTYGLFAIPAKGRNPWTLILSKTPKQWGAYSYKEADDFLRVMIKPLIMKEKIETLTMQFADVFPGSCQLHIMWENVALPIHLTTEYDATVMADIDKAMTSEKKPYYAAAQYYYYNNKDMVKALEWINAAEAANMKSASLKYWKARIQLKGGDKIAAIQTAQAGADIAKGNNDDEYFRLNSQVMAEAKK